MLSSISEVLLGLALAAALAGGTALFVIARQDDSRAGQILGFLIAVAGLVAAIYLTQGGHWP